MLRKKRNVEYLRFLGTFALGGVPGTNIPPKAYITTDGSVYYTSDGTAYITTDG